MQTGISYDQCRSFINCQIKPTGPGTSRDARTPRPFTAITISRQSGSGAHGIAEKLANRLQQHARPGGRPWTAFDKELVARILEDHHLPSRMAEFIPEDRRTELQDAVEELFGLRPPSWTLIQHASETILRLVELGNVILIGRGSTIVARHNPGVLHVRLVAAEAIRAERLAERRGISCKAALDALRKEDRGRARYLKKYFGSDIEDPGLYHAVINTGRLAPDRVVDLLASLTTAGPGNTAA